MEYICHKRYKGNDLNGKPVNLPYGTKLRQHEDYILTEKGNPICFRNSECCFMHFARNDDGQGLERGAISYSIAYSQRGHGFRFTEAQREIIVTKWSKYIRRDIDMILFNRDFFSAPVEDLIQMSKDLED